MRRKEERHVGLLAEKDAEEGSPLWCCQRRSHQGRATQSEEDHEADATEAFLHLLCLLREEFGGCYAPKMSSLAEIFASNNRILTPIQSDCQSDKWFERINFEVMLPDSTQQFTFLSYFDKTY
ncbi:hypothetical protein JHK82_012307 [Glycine max]|nr:hypothetical protein JHK87_012213 [Glycine soja]KAG5040185.1 hypothetical protein JHK85_012661 [Glycine max]KAG5057324.1 hypothetical protein JHK86_012320 [Glycine max]KAG5154338.1 hypothetical protein JHK82_012307 [Glycine max]